MVDRAKKISEFDVVASAANTDLFLIVSNAAGNGITKSITVATIVSAVANQTPGFGSNNRVLFVANNKNVGIANLTFDGNTLSVPSLIATGHVELGTANNGAYIIHMYGAIASNVVPDTPNNYFLGASSHPWNVLWASNIRSGNLSYNDTGIISQMTRSVDAYAQVISQNLSNNANASINVNVSNDLANSTANFGELGMNSSGFSGSGPFGHPSAVYIAAATSNLAIGTYDSHPAHIVVNSNITWTYGTDGYTTLPSGQIVFTGAATTRAAVNTQVGATGSNGSIYLSTAGKMYLRVDGTGVATTDWQRVTTTAAD